MVELQDLDRYWRLLLKKLTAVNLVGKKDGKCFFKDLFN